MASKRANTARPVSGKGQTAKKSRPGRNRRKSRGKRRRNVLPLQRGPATDDCLTSLSSGASGGREYASLNYLSVSLLDPLTRSFIERWVMLTGTLGIAAVGIDKFVAVME